MDYRDGYGGSDGAGVLAAEMRIVMAQANQDRDACLSPPL